MLHQITPPTTTSAPLPGIVGTDYDTVRHAIEFLSANWDAHPSLDRLADHLGLSPSHAQRLFKRWCGLSPKEFVQAIALDVDVTRHRGRPRRSPP